MEKLVSSILTRKDLSNIPAIKYGVDNESTAFDLYSKLLQSKTGGKKLEVRECGTFINPQYPWLGCSPDGLILDSETGRIVRLLEIKCPFTGKELTFEEF